MKSEKKLNAGFGLRISLAVFSAVGLISMDSPINAAPALGPTVVAVQDVAYEQDTIPSQYDLISLDPKRDRSEYSTRRQARAEFEKKVSDAVAGGSLSTSQQTDAANWIGRVIMAEMTLNNPTVQMEMGELRADLFRRYLTLASDANRAFIIDNIIIPKARDIAAKNYHPASRINAVQILNWLDVKEGQSGSQLPQPSRNALKELLNIVDNANSPEYLVATALAGVQRHCELDGQLPPRDRLPAAARNAVVDSLLTQLKKHEATRHETEPGYLISRRVVQSLSGLNLPTGDPKLAEVQTAIQSIANDFDAGRWLRMDAMIALGSMPLNDATAYVKQLGQLVALIGKQERQAMVAAQTRVGVEKQISEKTSAASAKKKTEGNKKRGGGLKGSGSGENQALGDGMGSPNGGMGGMGGGGMNMGMFADGGLLPFHLHYFRTNVKLATVAAQEILGTQDKARTGLRFQDSVKNNAELKKLIDDIDKQLRKMQTATDIGLVEEKELSRSERLRLPPEEQELLDQTPVVRVLAQTGYRVRDLEKLVGKVQLAGEEEDEKAVESIKAAVIPKADEDASAADSDAADATSGPEAPSTENPGRAPSTGGDETGTDTPATGEPGNSQPGSGEPGNDAPTGGGDN